MKHAAFGLALLAILMLLLSAAASAAVVYVKWDSPGPTFDGASWDTAFHTVQPGLDAAAPDDEVWVARGTYVECITLKDGVGLYGGFVGTETFRDQRDWNANLTTLDGNAAGSVVTSPSGATPATVVDGFTIRNGRAFCGAGIYADSCSPTIANNRITENQGTDEYCGLGAGIYCCSSTSTIRNNAITSNHVSQLGSGGGIYCSGSLLITDNTIQGNNGEDFGGGIFCSGGSPTIVFNTVAGNDACTDGGGIYCGAGTSPMISSNEIRSNQGGNGGGICCRNSSPSITLNVLTGNAGSFGGGIFCENSQAAISDNTITTNSAWDGGGIALSEALTSRIADNTIENNSGGGILVGSGSPVVTGNTITGNISCGGIRCWGGSPNIAGNLVLANDEYGIVCDGGSPTITGNKIKGTIGSDSAGILCAPSGGEIIGNTIEENSGDGVRCVYSCVVTIADNTIRANGDAGIDCGGGSTLTITNNVIADNAGAVDSGGGIRCENSSVAIYGNRITGNRAVASGGGIGCYACSGSICCNEITGNSLRGWGIGIVDGGGGVSCDSCSLSIASNVITNNFVPQGDTGSYGGGIRCNSSPSTTIVNNTIVGNNAPSGGGISSNSSQTVANNIIAFNTSGFLCRGGSPTLRNNCVYGNTSYEYSGVSAGIGDISVDPLFYDLASEYHLMPGSPCIDTGWNDAPSLTATDVDGENRIASSTVDIGADEYSGMLPIVSMPTFSPGGGTYSSPKSVVISCATTGATIHYTTNGYEPTDRDAVYSGPVLVDESAVLKAKAWKDDWLPSSVATAVYTLPAKTPTFSPDGGTYSPSCQVSIGCETLGADIWYTTNGEEPTPENGTLYTTPVLVSADLTLKARVYKEGSTPSAVQTAEYAIVRSVRDLKRRPDGFSVTIAGSMVSAAFPGFFYIEADDRSSGIRVESIGHALAVGMRADVVGTMRTNSDGERYVEAASAVQSAPPADTGSVVPILLCNRDLAGGDWLYDAVYGIGQIGVADNIGLNNIGLLVTTAGRVRYVSTGDVFVISDGFTHFDPSGVWGVRVAAPGLTKPARGKYVTVTGISSMFASGAERYPIILVRDQADIVIRQ